MPQISKKTLMLAAGALLVGLAGSAVWQFIPKDRAEDPVPTIADQRITVDVRNAGGERGMAARATDHLRSMGFDVVDFGNALPFGRDSTVVIDRVGEPERATAVARALGVNRIRSRPDPDLYVDVTVELGPEWTAPPQAEPSPGRIGLREWLRALAADGEAR